MGFNRPLHGLRGVASLMVFFAHISYGFYNHFYNQNAVMAFVVGHFAHVGTFGVELFFVISGYVIASSCLNYAPMEFFGRRFLRIYPLFLMFTLLYFVLNYYFPHEVDRGDLKGLLLNLAFLNLFLGTSPLTPNAWSVTFEVWCYVATYLIIYSLFRRADRFNPFLAILAIAFAGYMVAVYDITAYFAGGCVLFYVNGVILRNSYKIKHKSMWITILLIVIVVMAAIWKFPPKTYFEVPNTQMASFILLVSTLAFVFLRAPRRQYILTSPACQIFEVYGNDKLFPLSGPPLHLSSHSADRV